MAKILVTDGEQRASLAAVRSLGRAGHEVLVCSHLGRPLAGASRFARACYRMPDPAADPAAYRDGVESLLEAEHVEVLLPMTDVSALLLLSLRNDHPGLTIPFPELGAYEQASDKRLLMELAMRCGIPVPDQIVLDTRRDVDRVADIALPVVLKPARSAVVTEGGARKFGVRIVNTQEELLAALAACPDTAYPILIQQRIVGPGLGAFLLADRGRTVATFGHRRIREKPPTGGVSVYRESVSLREDVREYAERLLGELGWTGVAMVEFKEDAETGTPYLMEINGRFWGSLQLAIDAGVNFPDLLIRLSLGEDIVAGPPYREGLRSRWLWGDFDHLIWVLRAPSGYRGADPRLPGRLEAIAKFLIPWEPGMRYEVLRLSDPLPFVRETLEWFRSVLRRR